MAAAAALAGASQQPGLAQLADPDAVIAFDIPAQPLDSALTQYFRTTGVQLLYDSSVTQGRRSTAVYGRHRSREALRLLLTGTGLVARYSRNRAATIVPARRVENETLVPIGRVVVRERMFATLPPRERFRTYYLILESELQALLRNDAEVSRSAFDVTAAIRIDTDGKILSLEIKRGAENRQHDQRIAAALDGQTVSRPPAELPQPLVVVLRGKR